MGSRFSFKILLGLLLLGPASLAGDEGPVTLLCVGDIMLGHRLDHVITDKGPAHPFQKTRPLLQSADGVFGNLENPVTDGGTAHPDKKYTFRMRPAHTALLKDAGFRVVSLANNHTLDYGARGLADTQRHLDEAGILYSGAGANRKEAQRPAVLTLKDKKIAVLSYSRTFPLEFTAKKNRPGTAFGSKKEIRRAIRKAQDQADWVLVSFHWGQEYSDQAKDYQQELARLSVDAGADAIIGHHPHVVQGLELYKGKIIAYSLGNFVFGTYNERASGLAVKLIFKDGENPQAELFPLDVKNHRTAFQTAPLQGEALQLSLSHLQRLTEGLGSSLRLEGERAFFP